MSDFKAALRKKQAELHRAQKADGAVRVEEKSAKGPSLGSQRTSTASQELVQGPPKSDAELFLEAVRGVNQDAVLEKYSTSLPPPAGVPSPEARRLEEQRLFETFVGPIDRPFERPFDRALEQPAGHSSDVVQHPAKRGKSPRR